MVKDDRSDGRLGRRHSNRTTASSSRKSCNLSLVCPVVSPFIVIIEVGGGLCERD